MKNILIEIVSFFQNHLKHQLEGETNLDMHITLFFLNISFFTLRRKYMAVSVNTMLVSGYKQSLIVISNKVFRIIVAPRIDMLSITYIRQSLAIIETFEELLRKRYISISLTYHILELENLLARVGCYKSLKLQSSKVFQIFKEVFQKHSQTNYNQISFNDKQKINYKYLLLSFDYFQFNCTLSKYNNYLMQIITNKQTGAQYKLLAQVGKGANAKVYKGQSMATSKIVAVKRMNNMTDGDARMAKKEVQLMKLFNHKNIVKWVDDFRDKGIWYIVLEYCGNGDLQAYKSRTGKIPEYNCKSLVRGVLEALVQLHTEKKIVVEINKKKTEINKKKIAHRDLKLANILIDDNFQLKLADFGFSKDFQNAWMTTFAGSPVTMAPEVIRRQQYNQKCDVWSLGVITYYLLFNKYPFWPTGSQANSYNALVNLISNSKHTFDPEVQLSEDGKDFINRCLTKSIKQRPDSHQLLNHPWWASLKNGLKWSDIRSETIKLSLDKDFKKQAETKLMNVFYGVCEQHANKLIDAYLINEAEIMQILPLFNKYYHGSKYVDYYCHLIVKKFHQLKNREIMLTIKKQKFSFTLAEIKETEMKFARTLKLIGDLKAVENVNIAEELAIFLSYQADKLMESFNQDQVDDKRILFRQLAKFLTTAFDFTLINIEWGKNQDLKELQSPIFDIVLKLTSQNIVDMINLKEKTDKDLEAIWTIQHHISESTDHDGSYEMELGKLVLKIMEVPSNFNIDKTMHTDLLEMKPHQFNQIGFLNYQ